MLKKRINKIKTKQKQRQKQMQIVNVNIHKPTRRPRQGPPQRNVQQLPTPQYIYTSQTDSLVPQMFNKQGQQESMPTLSEQINKSLEEKLNKIASQYNISMTKPTQPTQQEVRQTRTETYKPNKQKMIKEYTINQPKQTQSPGIFKKEADTTLSTIQNDPPVIKAPDQYMKQNEPINIYNTVAKSSSTVEGVQQNTAYSLIKQPHQRSTSVINKERYKTPTREEMRNLRIPPVTYKLPDEFIKKPALSLVPESPENSLSPQVSPIKVTQIKDLKSNELIDYKKEIKKRIANNEMKRETPGLNKQGKGHITRLINKDKQKIVEINNEINTRTDIKNFK